jgi:hypothetical protein
VPDPVSSFSGSFSPKPAGLAAGGHFTFCDNPCKCNSYPKEMARFSEDFVKMRQSLAQVRKYATFETKPRFRMMPDARPAQIALAATRSLRTVTTGFTPWG